MLSYFKFSWKVTLVAGLLIFSFLRLSYWQWERHLEKQKYVQMLEDRIKQPVVALEGELSEAIANPDAFVNRRFSLSGEYDFSREIYIRNRSLNGEPGKLVVTPLHLGVGQPAVLVSRGFIPLKESIPDRRTAYQGDRQTSIIGLFKPAARRRWLAPRDPPTGQDLPPVTDFLRIDIEHIGAQFPYSLAPFYLEILPDINPSEMPAEIVRGESDKEELLILPLKGLNLNKATNTDVITSKVPIPMFSTVVPTIRHLGYVFEWATMALMTLLVALVLQFKRPTTR